MLELFLAMLLSAGVEVWELAPGELRQAGDEVAGRVLTSEPVRSHVALHLHFASRPAMPPIEQTPYAIARVKGLTADEVIARFGEPYFDSREGDGDGVGDGVFKLVYLEPGGVFGWYAVLEFDKGKVVETFPQGK